ncbi:hypothetical protein DSM110093_04232 (plasmid) [Sulfitobacter sp. DSM 110093]|uniref:hypothetical protein n=1 Tax=Sulfitobacter sp. DSM 110093 TaxID=2883127 RepID=UPI001FADF18E|nr:hypothetical protein [Sulfitobacter sp. DSM 110093]UOA34396.1 hypothetical protein DSM110093_04232 [Sulfitobacter sp. DSM 110093]
MSIITLHSPSDVHDALQSIRQSAIRAQKALAALPRSPLEAMEALKFEPMGSHPLEDRPLNIIEQVNQTFTYLAAVKAAGLLMQWHPEAEGFRLAPGAHAPKGTLDVESLVPGIVGAETFAAVRPENNRKLANDLAKLVNRAEHHRYVFFISPVFPRTERLPGKERDGVKVYSIALGV